MVDGNTLHSKAQLRFAPRALQLALERFNRLKAYRDNFSRKGDVDLNLGGFSGVPFLEAFLEVNFCVFKGLVMREMHCVMFQVFW